jgi:hypothetical protein
MPAEFDRELEEEKLAHVRAEEEEDLVRILSEKHGIAYTDLAFVPLNVDALRVIPEADAREATAVAFEKNGKHLSIAVHQPDNDAFARLTRRLEDEGFILQKFLVSEKSLKLAYDRYAELSHAVESDAGVFRHHGRACEGSWQLRRFPSVASRASYRTRLEQKQCENF